jgi:hypothetical protein
MRIKDRFQQHFQGHLYHTIPHRRYAKQADSFTSRLGNFQSKKTMTTVGAFAKVFYQAAFHENIGGFSFVSQQIVTL